MDFKTSRAAFAAACFMGLAGCTTSQTSNNPFVKLDDVLHSSSASAADKEATGSISMARATDAPDVSEADASDPLSAGKEYFRQGHYELAEQQFQKSVALHPRDAESWVCLAAANDRLRHFDVADHAYARAIKLIGRTPEVMNNQGFSFMLRGDYRRARATLLAVRAKDPKSPFIANNLRLLDESVRRHKAAS